ncbi:hypothetical protein [Streptomyces winkii]|nr:hypothetical protein [Streptomyces sp. DSM 40971]
MPRLRSFDGEVGIEQHLDQQAVDEGQHQPGGVPTGLVVPKFQKRSDRWA